MTVWGCGDGGLSHPAARAGVGQSARLCGSRFLLRGRTSPGGRTWRQKEGRFRPLGPDELCSLERSVLSPWKTHIFPNTGPRPAGLRSILHLCPQKLACRALARVRGACWPCGGHAQVCPASWAHLISSLEQVRRARRKTHLMSSCVYFHVIQGKWLLRQGREASCVHAVILPVSETTRRTAPSFGTVRDNTAEGAVPQGDGRCNNKQWTPGVLTNQPPGPSQIPAGRPPTRPCGWGAARTTSRAFMHEITASPSLQLSTTPHRRPDDCEFF